MDRRSHIAIAIIATIIMLEIFLYEKFELNKRNIRACYPAKQLTGVYKRK